MRALLPLILSVGTLLVSGPSVAGGAADLVGAWKLVSIAAEDVETKQRSQFWGEHPNGRLIFTADGQMIALLTGEGRKPPQTEAERSVAFTSMAAYSGRYRVEGDRFVTKVDMAWNENWVGTEQLRHYRIDGNMLYIETDPRVDAGFANRLTRFVLSWEKEN